MKKKWQELTKMGGEAFQEISQDLSWSLKKLKKLAESAELNREDRTQDLSSPRFGENAAATTDPAEETRKKVALAIHRAYYKEGGFRYFGCNLQRYVKVVLPQETDPAIMWASGYNSCIHSMIRQLERLEAELMEIRKDYGRPLPVPENKEILEKMRLFKKKAIRGNLQLQTAWEPEEYRDALQQYAQELTQQLLEPYQLPADS